MSTDDRTALYRRDGDLFDPSTLTGGPWAPGVQAGSATSALLAWTVEQVPTLGPMRTVRYTFDLLRPAPMHPLEARSEVLREGKRIQVVEASLVDGDVVVARCRALRLRRGQASPPEVENPALPPIAVPPPPGGQKWAEENTGVALPGIMGAFDVRQVEDPDPAWSTTSWLRFLAPVVDGMPTPPVVALAAAADFVSNSANHADHDQWSMVNADVSVDVIREPTSDWLALAVRTSFGSDGIGHSVGRIYDEHQFVATAMTMGLVEHHA